MGVKSNVSGVVVIPEEGAEGTPLPEISVGLDGFLRRFPPDEGTGGLADADGNGKREEECGSNLLNLGKVGVGGARNLSSKERVEALADEVADGRHHGDAAVGDLGLTEALDFLTDFPSTKPNGSNSPTGARAPGSPAQNFEGSAVQPLICGYFGSSGASATTSAPTSAATGALVETLWGAPAMKAEAEVIRTAQIASFRL